MTRCVQRSRSRGVLADLTVPASSRSFPLVKEWVEDTGQRALIGEELVARLEDAVLEACRNALGPEAWSDEGRVNLERGGEIRLSARHSSAGLRIEVLEPCDYALALATDGPRRREGLGLPRMAFLVDELSIRKVGRETTMISLFVRRRGASSTPA